MCGGFQAALYAIDCHLSAVLCVVVYVYRHIPLSHIFLMSWQICTITTNRKLHTMKYPYEQCANLLCIMYCYCQFSTTHERGFE